MSNNALFQGIKEFFVPSKTKDNAQKKENKTKENQAKTNKEGVGPSEVALWATSPDP